MMDKGSPDGDPPTATPRRVKVYLLQGEDWIDNGTGYCVGEVDAAAKTAYFLVRNELDEGTVILKSFLNGSVHYQRQQETLIVWTDSAGKDLALSFQETEGCADLCQFIIRVQRDGISPGISLHYVISSMGDGEEVTELITGPVTYPPEPSLANLEAVLDALQQGAKHQYTRDKIAPYYLKRDYLLSLAAVFGEAEGKHELEAIWLLGDILKTVLSYAEASMVEDFFASDAKLMAVVGILEYDPATPTMKACHRQHLAQRQLTQVVPVENVAMFKRDFDLNFLKNVVLARYFDDSTNNMLSTLIYTNQVDIINYLISSEVLAELFALYKGCGELIGGANGVGGGEGGEDGGRDHGGAHIEAQGHGGKDGIEVKTESTDCSEKAAKKATHTHETIQPGQISPDQATILPDQSPTDETTIQPDEATTDETTIQPDQPSTHTLSDQTSQKLPSHPPTDASGDTIMADDLGDTSLTSPLNADTPVLASAELTSAELTPPPTIPSIIPSDPSLTTRRRHGVRMLHQYILMTKSLPSFQKQEFYTSIIARGLFDMVYFALSDSDNAIRVLGIELTTVMIEQDVSMVHAMASAVRDHGAVTPLYQLLLQLLGEQSAPGLKLQAFEAIKILLDPNASDAEFGSGVDDAWSAYLRGFYRHIAPALFGHLRTSRDPALLQHLCELVAICLKDHPDAVPELHQFWFDHGVLASVAALVNSSHRIPVRLAAVRCLKLIVAQADAACIAHIVDHNLLQGVFDWLAAIAHEHSLANSTCLDLIELARHTVNDPATCSTGRYMARQFRPVLQQFGVGRALLEAVDAGQEPLEAASTPLEATEVIAPASVASDDEKADHAGVPAPVGKKIAL
ncbi:serine/threonine-protein phosphatase 4 regulatory subunit 3 [Diutina catenulata]